MSTTPQELFDGIAPYINSGLFDFDHPINPTSYFPDVLNQKLHSWFDHYKTSACVAIDNLVPFQNGEKDVTLTRCGNLIEGLKNVVESYYYGDILGATEKFNETMNQGFRDINKLSNIGEGKQFFRARIGINDSQFERKDLFHLPFEMRHLVSTNRYSVPGFPALYLGDCTYVCWEEYGRHRLRDLFFSRFENKRKLSMVDIKLYPEFNLELITEPDPIKRLGQIMRFVCTYPLTIACTIPVKQRSGSFKPEYIIPQLLLQYVTLTKSVDGIRFPSSRVNYDKLYKVESYNYVFPVKSVLREGYCSELKKTFALTHPTSLELEEVIHNPQHLSGMFLGNGFYKGEPSIELTNGVKSGYNRTSFGKLENILNRRELAALP